MKKYSLIILNCLLAILVIGIASCTKESVEIPNLPEKNNEVVGLVLDIQNCPGANVTNGEYVFENVDTKETFSVPFGEDVSAIPDGNYDITFKGDGSVSTTRSFTELVFYGESKNLRVENGILNYRFVVYANSVEATKDFLIAEIFPSGTMGENGRQYNGGDQYFRIVNNSDHVLYADGLVIMESLFMGVFQRDYTPNIQDTHLAVQAVMRIPGDGTTYKVEPGQSIIICDNAVNHKIKNQNSMDLSNADFEWFIDRPDANPRFRDEKTEGKIALEEIYNMTMSLWILNKQGNKTYAIGRMPKDVTKESYLRDYQYIYKFPISETDWSRDLEGYKFPNDWIIDAVNLCPVNNFVWLVSPLDEGYTYVGKTRFISDHYDKAVIRKKKDGKYVDINNSEEDFDAAQKASLLN